MRLLGGVLDHRQPLCPDSRQNGVHGCPHGHHIQIDLTAPEPVCGHIHHAVVNGTLGTQCGECLQMLVNGTIPQGTSPRHGHPCPVVLAQQRPQEVVGGTHLPCAFVGNAAVQDPSGVDPVGGLVEHIHLRPHLVQDPQTNGNITDIGYIFDDAWLVRQDHRRKDRNCRILGTADFHFSHQLASALDDKFIQTFSLLIFSPSVVPGGENRFAAGTLFFCLLNLFCSVSISVCPASAGLSGYWAWYSVTFMLSMVTCSLGLLLESTATSLIFLQISSPSMT